MAKRKKNYKISCLKSKINVKKSCNDFLTESEFVLLPALKQLGFFHQKEKQFRWKYDKNEYFSYEKLLENYEKML